RFPLGGNHPQEDCMPGSMQYSLCQTYCSTSSTYPMHLLWQSTIEKQKKKPNKNCLTEMGYSRIILSSLGAGALGSGVRNA
ncbi:MAG: hypothetical protein QM271_08155, partial [Bacillota bacterium]|nr:hypothetical protein [Bacillota bacterium]